MLKLQVNHFVDPISRSHSQQHLCCVKYKSTFLVNILKKDLRCPNKTRRRSTTTSSACVVPNAWRWSSVPDTIPVVWSATSRWNTRSCSRMPVAISGTSIECCLRDVDPAEAAGVCRRSARFWILRIPTLLMDWSTVSWHLISFKCKENHLFYRIEYDIKGMINHKLFRSNIYT